MMNNELSTRVAERIGFAEHFGCLSLLALLRNEIAANDAHIYEARHSLLLFCGDVEHGRTDGKPREDSGLAGLSHRTEQLGASWRKDG
jgi:hypothetical protein